MGQCRYLDVSAELGGETLLLHIFNSSFTPEQIDGHTRRQKTLMLLPLQRLKKEKKTDSEQITTTFSLVVTLLVCVENINQETRPC